MLYSDYQPAKTRAWLDLKIEVVMKRTGCNKEQAIAELEAEEWDTSDAILNIISNSDIFKASRPLAAA